MQKFNLQNTTDFSFLDQADFVEQFAFGINNNEMRFFISGITCAKCVRKLEDLPLTTPGLLRLRVDMGRNLAFAEVDPRVLSYSELAQRIVAAGFKPIPLRHDSDLTSLESQSKRIELIRLGVGAACAGNIMTFSFANYFGASADLLPLFETLSFVLYLPVLFFVAVPFYKGAWRSLKQKQISVDLPMAIASVAGFLFSSVQLYRGHHDIYFDSLSGFLFLILLARYFQRRLQTRLLRAEELSEILDLGKVRKVFDGGWSWKPLNSLAAGDRILLHAQETLPADAELINSRSHFSLAWLSGESKSKTFLKGAIVPAGSRLATGEAHLRVKKILDETNFGKILSEVQKLSLTKNNLVTLSDKWAQILLTIVFSIAIVFLLSYWFISPEEAIRRSLALIILACPCALAFGTPLAIATGLKKAHKSSLIIRDANVFEKIKSVTTIFFDKTGTLTDTELSLNESTSHIPAVYRKIILALENDSMHPIAFAFRNAFDSQESLPPVDGLREVAGQGVSGFIYGKLYELKSNSVAQNQISCTLFEDQHALYNFFFDAQLRPDALAVIDQLRSRNYRVILLSGDQSESVLRVASQLQFKSKDVISEASPQDKLEYVAKTPNAMMIGDGVNDSLAMQKAQVSIAATGGAEVALRNSDIYLASTSLAGIIHLFDTSQVTLSLIKQNLILSGIYNVLGGTLALLGFINPFVAALLMPLSSGIILLNTWRRSRS